jgi:hypothetical protein
MLRMIARFTLAVALTLCLDLAFTPLGCGGRQGDGPAVPHHHEDDEGPTVPDATVSALRACVEQGKARLKESGHAFQFDVEVTESGHSDRVKVKGSYPSDHGMESCMAGALEGLSVPPFVVQALLADADPPPSRGSMGFVMVLAGGVALVPVFITAAGVTVIVGVTIYLSKEVTETIKRRRRSREQCLKMYIDCTDRNYAPCNKRFEHTQTLLCSICQTNCDNHDPYTLTECTQCGFR